MNVKGKSVMITGAGGGLGSEMARLLAKNGAKVFILDLVEDKGETVAAEIVADGGEAWFFKCDVTSEENWKAAMDFALEKTGRQNEAMNQYRGAEQQKYHYLNQPLSEEQSAFVRALIEKIREEEA